MRKSAFCMCENKGADRRLCFRFFLNPNFQVSLNTLCRCTARFGRKHELTGFYVKRLKLKKKKNRFSFDPNHIQGVERN